MKPTFLLIILIQISSYLFSQKKLLNHSVPPHWPIISSEKISNDGRYICYTIGSRRGNYTKGPEIIDSILVIQSTDSAWRREMPAPSDGALFTQDSRNLIFQKANDSLGIFDLATIELHYIGPISSFKLPKEGNGRRIAYQLKDAHHTLVLRDLTNGDEISFADVTDYLFNNDGQILLIQKSDTTAGGKSNFVLWVNQNNGKITVIGHGCIAKNVIFDKTGAKVAFLGIDPGEDEVAKTLRYYQDSMDSAEILVDSSTPGMHGMGIGRGDMFFSDKGDKIFFTIENRSSSGVTKTTTKGARVDIWNYSDGDVQSVENNSPFLSVIQVDKYRKVLRLQQNEDYCGFAHLSDIISKDGNYVISFSDAVGNSGESKWRRSARPNIYLISTNDGSRKLLNGRLIGDCIGFSPSGKFVLWYDRTKMHWFAYNVELGSTKNITSNIHSPLNYDFDVPGFSPPAGIAGWLEGDAVLIYDRYDIWKVDLDGKNPPINVTNRYGTKGHTELRIINFAEKFPSDIPFIHLKDTLYLSAFDRTTKFNGFFKVRLGQSAHLEYLTMGPNIYYFPTSFPSQLGAVRPIRPLKAKNVPVYLLSKMSDAEYPNLVLTTDFVHFKPVTILRPQKEYNWYTSELVKWKLPDGRIDEGILYKPENFNTHKKYPLIFFYYEKCASGLNFFLHPELSNGTISIPWFVSNGYLVFVPDIYYKSGYPGESAYNSIVTAAKILSNNPWVDAKHMGLQGHSFGGWETEYIITRTSLFAAAASAAGCGDLVASYGGVKAGRGEQVYFEVRQGRIGGSLWEKPGLYIQNSPIFKADRVTTPLLIMHNQGDNTVPFSQDVQFYNGLCRLGKRVWMLSYDGDGHTIEDKTNALDYSIRLGQFFDHFLKEAPAPRWMTKGVPRRLKGIDYGFELDTNGEKDPR